MPAPGYRRSRPVTQLWRRPRYQSATSCQISSCDSGAGSRPGTLEEEILPGVPLGLQHPALVHEVGERLERCRGGAELQLIRPLRIHHLDDGLDAAFLRLMLVVDLRRLF